MLKATKINILRILLKQALVYNLLLISERLMKLKCFFSKHTDSTQDKQLNITSSYRRERFSTADSGTASAPAPSVHAGMQSSAALTETSLQNILDHIKQTRAH